MRGEGGLHMSGVGEVVNFFSGTPPPLQDALSDALSSVVAGRPFFKWAMTHCVGERFTTKGEAGTQALENYTMFEAVKKVGGEAVKKVGGEPVNKVGDEAVKMWVVRP